MNNTQKWTLVRTRDKKDGQKQPKSITEEKITIKKGGRIYTYSF